ncbi:hypothetical protein HA402_015007 [Bradysia odoriphaga]|nr:hypothetical protein HA402_015007 [Bradysia odoriphaga]
MLQSLVDNSPALQIGPMPSEESQKLWSEIATKLNQVPGPTKTWVQWRQTWRDIKKNSDNAIEAAGRVHTRLSRQQKKMLQKLVDSLPALQIGSLPSEDSQKLWTKIATQLNQVPGARKTWVQWRQTWRDIKNNSDSAIEAARTVHTRLSGQQKTMLQNLVDNSPALQRGPMPSEDSQKLWTKIATQLNQIPGDKKTWLQWRQTWTDIKNHSDSAIEAARRVHSKLSKQQKTMLHSLVDNLPALQIGSIPSEDSENLWTKIATQLNQLPGPTKTWVQWRQTWRDIKKNSKKSQTQILYDSDRFTDHEWSISDEMVSDKINISCAAMDDNGDDSDDNDEFFAKRRRAKNMSKTQKKLLYKLVTSNATLQKTNETSTVYCLKKQKEWQRIAVKLNSVTGPRKTWEQWKKCWHDIRAYYVQRNAVDQLSDSDSNDVGMSDTDATRGCMNANEMSDCTPSVAQLIGLATKMAEHRNEANANIWISLSNNLNDLGPCVKDGRGWKKIWNDHKRKIKELVVENGARNLDNLQRLTYECIQRERERNDSASSILKAQQLRLLQGTADQECNAVGSLVAVKLRSMEKEQKLIAEKLISEVLFQGQMEMFQYSDKAVDITGYF